MITPTRLVTALAFRFCGHHTILSACGLSISLAAQAIVLPANAVGVEGAGSHRFPFGPHAGPFPGVRIQQVYDSTNLTSQGITGPIHITGIRWRINGGSQSSGGTYSGCTIAMASAAVDYTAVSTDWASNQDSDYQVCYSGPVTVSPTGAATPGGWFVNQALTTPFVYDPTLGKDLIIDCDRTPFWSGGLSTNHDVSTVGSLSSRVWSSTTYPVANGVTQDHGLVVELQYLPAASVATRGTGCIYQRSSAYEYVPAQSTLDLTFHRVDYIRQAGGYSMTTTPAGGYSLPVNHVILPMGDETCSPPLTMPFSFPYLDKYGNTITTTQIVACSNGYVWLDPTQSAAQWLPTATLLCSQAPRIAAHWTDLHPGLGGTVSYGVSSGGTVFQVTWDQVSHFQSMGSPFTTSVQLSLHSNGDFSIAFGAASNALWSSIVGWSPGNGALLAPGTDLSAPGGVWIAQDMQELQLTALSLPRLNTLHTTRIDNIATGTFVGVMALGFTPAQLDLGPFGLTGGCTQWSAFDVTDLLLPIGSQASWQFAVPNMPSFAGLQLFEQAVMLSPGLNPAGLVVSNGLVATIGA